MQINRLFEIVYILLNKKAVTAKELAERFAVSVRTVYRDVETLSSAGIPIYMSKGRGGGIRLMDGFVLNKSMLSESEQQEVLSALHGMNVFNVPEMDAVLDKLGAVFNKSAANWIDIDFSYWGSDSREKEKFHCLKNVILSKKKITFDYRAPGRQTEARKAEPLQIYFKEKSWYLKAYDAERKDYRTFKISRMKNIE
ncbi:MAG: YafY family transcriptional regulator, partial [Clostridiales bacterium]|nr:YafY family transcriptional regulator [Clostridiales bacterium]